MARREALLIGNSDFSHPQLAELAAPENDVIALKEILEDPEVGRFKTKLVLNAGLDEVRDAIVEHYENRVADDLLLFYYTGHGLRDNHGNFYLALPQTDPDSPRAKSLEKEFLIKSMNQSYSRRQVMILDCCHSGAIMGDGAKSAPGPVITAKDFDPKGYGRFVLSATSSAESAFEVDGKSIFTKHLIEGLKDGAAAPGKSEITIQDLHTYVSKNLAEDRAPMRPHIWVDEQTAPVVIAHNARPKQSLAPSLVKALWDDDPLRAHSAAIRLADYTKDDDDRARDARKELRKRLQEEAKLPLLVARPILEVLEPPTGDDNTAAITELRNELADAQKAEAEAKDRWEKEQIALKKKLAETKNEVATGARSGRPSYLLLCIAALIGLIAGGSGGYLYFENLKNEFADIIGFRVVELETDLEAKNKKIEIDTATINSLEEAANVANSNFAALSVKFDDASKELNEAEDEAAIDKAEINRLNVLVSDSATTLASLETELETANSNAAADTAVIFALKDAAETDASTIEELNLSLLQAGDDATNLRQEIERIRAKATNDIHELTTTMNARVSATEKDVLQARLENITEISDLKTQLDSARRDAATAAETITNLENDVTRIQNESANELKELREVKLNSENRIVELEESLRSVRSGETSKVTALSEELDTASKLAFDSAVEIRRLKTVIARTEAKNQELVASENAAENRNIELEKALKIARAESMDETTRLTERLAELDSQADKDERENSRLNTELEQIKTDLNNQLARFKELERELTAITTERDTIADEKRAADELIAQLESQLAAVSPPTDDVPMQTPETPEKSGVPKSDPATLAPLEKFNDCKDLGCPEMVVIPAGRFLMGEVKTPVNISKFAMAETEVTFNQWKACVNDSGCKSNKTPGNNGWGEGNRPVIRVSWLDANEYVAWLNNKVAGRPYRLPSESEWEYAARAGSTTTYYFGDVFDVTRVNVKPGPTVEVDEMNAANPWQLRHMLGNVTEWVDDCWHSDRDLGGIPNDGSSWDGGCPVFRHKVVRGGSWRLGKNHSTSTSRKEISHEHRYSYVGFRVARSLPAE